MYDGDEGLAACALSDSIATMSVGASPEEISGKQT